MILIKTRKDDVCGVLARVVKAERGRQGLTQSGLAMRAIVSMNVVRRIEDGFGATIDNANRVLGALGMTLADVADSPKSNRQELERTIRVLERVKEEMR